MVSGTSKIKVEVIIDEWRDIPGFSRYQVTSDGRLKRKADGFELKIRESETSVGTYKAVNVYDDTGKRRIDYGFHRLVCLAFHGLPPTVQHTDVNHKDLVKHNNRPDNLEWSTRSENVEHSYREGNRKDARKVTMLDHQTGEHTVFHSMSALARWAELKHLKGWHFARRYKTEKYQGRYTFDLDDVDYIVPNRKHMCVVYAFDVDNRKLIVVDNLGELELITGLKRTTAVATLNRTLDRRRSGNFVLWRYGEDLPTSIKEHHPDIRSEIE